MGAVITFPEGKRALGAPPAGATGTDATVIILPVVRIEREGEAPSGSETTKSSSPRKRRRRASRP